MTTEIHAPYHFVPLSKWVYMPDWAHLVSHDHPFEDGHSGIIDYTLTNHTPLCVGDTTKNNVLQFARNPEGTPIIPGSSLKGMIRNVLEIASFGKFSNVDDLRLSYRDISANSLYLQKVINNKDYKVQSGWIRFNESRKNWEFFSCDNAKIKHQTLNALLSTKIKNDDYAVKKYYQIALNQSIFAHISEPKGKAKNRWAEFLDVNLQEGKTEGHCIFTNKRVVDLNRGKAEDYEFSYFFYNRKAEVVANNIERQVSDLFANHQSVVTVKDENDNKIDGNLVKYLQKNQHKEYGIPVFALLKRGQVFSFGFARMPRISYENSTLDLVKKLNSFHADPAVFDMAELMFGTLRDRGFGLKSRVIFSDAILNTKLKEDDIYSAQPTVLSNPKPSFLGAYIEQDKTAEYRSYDESDARLSGWKRYGSQQLYNHYEPERDKEKSKSKMQYNKFELLREDHQFKGRIVFHNLKDEELSALIWCLTLNNDPSLRHSLGFAKPLGAGSVSFDVKAINAKSNSGEPFEQSTSALCCEFTQHMNDRYFPQGKWTETPQIKYLLSMANPMIDDENNYSYMPLKRYQTIKNEKGALPNVTHYGENLKRDAVDNLAESSLAFCKGRLSALFDSTNSHHDKALNEIAVYEDLLEKRNKKHITAQKQQALANASPFEKAVGWLELTIERQSDFNGTEKKQKTRELREYSKEVKELSLDKAQAKQLKVLFEQITLSKKDTDKIIKYLETIA